MSYIITEQGNIQMYAGDYAEIPITMVDADENPVDLTNAYIYLTAKASLNQEDPDLQVITTSHSDPTNGISSIIITKEDSAITPQKYHAELRIDFDATPDPDLAKPNRFRRFHLIIDESLS